MSKASDRFLEGVVFRICCDCKKIVGCCLLGHKDDCKTCHKTCFFRKTKMSVEGHSLLEILDSSTTTFCEVCCKEREKEIIIECGLR